MLLLLVLLIMLLVIGAFLIATIGVVGGVGIIMFSDVIVCVFILIWLIKKLIKKHKK